MAKARNNKLIAFLLSLVIVSFLQLNWKAGLGWTPEFVMALMVVSGFCLDIFEMAVLSAAGIFMFGWRPGVGWETPFFFFIPFLIVFARRFLPWSAEVNNIAGAVIAVSLFYSVTDFAAVLSNAQLFALIVGMTAGFGAAAFQLFNYFYKISQT